MRIALLSDLHANLRAFEACVADARALGTDRFALLGDLVGYGAEPAEVVDRVRALADAGAWVLRGNHDTLAADPPATARRIDEGGAAWTAERLGEERRAWLRGLPLMARVRSACLVHASAESPAAWPYVDDERRAARCLEAALAADPSVRHVICGHVHVQRLFYRGAGRGLMAFEPSPGAVVPVPPHRHWVATIGSVGQPRDGRTSAAWALLDLARGQLQFRRVVYDHVAAARAVEAAGLPQAWGRRLLAGR
ncbi:metallophosphoesterase family protein [Piscinibacter sakaiensis]|uniref:Mlr6579 protein n=1 Tax=Piscinibacter sakaiensis TaxID=1547922 RepID=A0A0K8P9N2_PISS1|nr:metallophosphoesterase family protein [Piscinibacter sakaiensis]GAP38885.1 Mlr6579 protein [Piscinibacter sakaiensis]